MKPFDAKGAFHPTAEGNKLRQLAVRGAGATLLSGGLGLAIQVVATMVLARLLTPRDFGLVTMVTTFSLLLMNFGLNGFTEAIIQREELDHALASNLFWIEVGASFVLAVAFAGSGSLLTSLYKDPRLAGVTRLLALTIFISGLSVIHMALLKRCLGDRHSRPSRFGHRFYRSCPSRVGILGPGLRSPGSAGFHWHFGLDYVSVAPGPPRPGLWHGYDGRVRDKQLRALHNRILCK